MASCKFIYVEIFMMISNSTLLSEIVAGRKSLKVAKLFRGKIELKVAGIKFRKLAKF